VTPDQQQIILQAVHSSQQQPGLVVEHQTVQSQQVQSVDSAEAESLHLTQ